MADLEPTLSALTIPERVRRGELVDQFLLLLIKMMNMMVMVLATTISSLAATKRYQEQCRSWFRPHFPQVDLKQWVPFIHCLPGVRLKRQRQRLLSPDEWNSFFFSCPVKHSIPSYLNNFSFGYPLLIWNYLLSFLLSVISEIFPPSSQLPRPSSLFFLNLSGFSWNRGAGGSLREQRLPQRLCWRLPHRGHSLHSFKTVFHKSSLLSQFSIVVQRRHS